MRSVRVLFATASVLASVSAFSQVTSIPFVAPRYFANTNQFATYLAKVTSVSLDDNGTFEADLNGLWGQVGVKYDPPFSMKGATGIAVTVTNLSDVPAELGLRLDFSKAAIDNNGPWNYGLFIVDKGATSTVVMPFNPPTQGHVGLTCMFPYVSGQTATAFGSATDPALLQTVYRWIVYANKNVKTHIRVSNIRMVYGQPSTSGVVDAYGQYTKANWPGKVYSDADLLTNEAAETLDLVSHPAPTSLQGDLDTPATTPGGWRTTVDASGRSYFLTPSGRQFWSLGLDSLSSDLYKTVLSDRWEAFSYIPSGDTFLTKFLGTQTMPDGDKYFANYYRMNLYRKYGLDWADEYTQRARQRMLSWGFNTLGCWSSPAVAGNDMPFEGHISTQAFSDRMPAADGVNTIPDPFSPNFAPWLKTNIPAQLAGIATMPNLMGVTGDNELYWGRTYRSDGSVEFVRTILTSSTSYAKTAFVANLQAKYGAIAALNASWGTSYADWTMVGKDGLASATLSGYRSDVASLLGMAVSKYYQQVGYAVHQAAPKALYLGSRQGLWGTPKEAMTAALPYVDVMSMNIYGLPESIDWNYLKSLAKPILLTEFSFAASDTGMFPGWGCQPGTGLSSQQHRADALTRYLKAAQAVPNIIGAEWQSYVDMPLLGRLAGDNFNYGLVSAADVPYKPMIDSLRAFASTIYSQ